MAVTSPCSDTILPEMASTGRGAPVRGSTSPMDPLRRIAPGSKKRFDTNEEKCASFACTVRRASAPAAGSAVNRRSAGAFIITMLAFGSVTRIGSATESMMRSRRSRSARASASASRSLR